MFDLNWTVEVIVDGGGGEGEGGRGRAGKGRSNFCDPCPSLLFSFDRR